MRRLVLALVLLLAACGGGGGGPSASGSITPAPALRTDLLFGYYGMNGSAATETADHANLVWAADFYGPLEQMATLTQAKGLGKKAVVMVPAYNWDPPRDRDEVTLWLKRLNDAGLLWDGILALYPIDEPNNRDPDEIRAKNAMLRDVMAQFPALKSTKLAVIYACKGSSFPGADTYDIIGCDDYDSGCAVFPRYYLGLQGANPAALLIAVAGGSDPWRQDPACFETYAHGTKAVWGLVGFAWQTVTDQGHTYTGIRENPTRALYCNAGRKIIGGAPC